VAGALPHLRDLSHWNAKVDWRLEKRRGLWGVYLNCGQGINYNDPTFRRRLVNATYAGFWRVGAYLFTVPGSGSPQAQADHLLKLAPKAPGRLRPCLDCESNPLRLPPQKLAAWYAAAVAHIQARTGYWPTIYGPPSFLGSFATADRTAGELFGKCPLWLAEYGVRVPRVPDPWTHYSAWQYTDAYSDPAVGMVDDSLVADGQAITIPIRAKGSWVLP
jgi:GH25 family lysozyme M1 (1,4-beta-N-acetylmuramidase)